MREPENILYCGKCRKKHTLRLTSWSPSINYYTCLKTKHQVEVKKCVSSTV